MQLLAYKSLLYDLRDGSRTLGNVGVAVESCSDCSLTYGQRGDCEHRFAAAELGSPQHCLAGCERDWSRRSHCRRRNRRGESYCLTLRGRIRRRSQRGCARSLRHYLV